MANAATHDENMRAVFGGRKEFWWLVALVVAMILVTWIVAKIMSPLHTVTDPATRGSDSFGELESDRSGRVWND